MFISVWQGFQTQKHNRLSVRPLFTFSNNTDIQRNTFQVVLSNQGYGPAIIKSYEIYIDGEKHEQWLPGLQTAIDTVVVNQWSTYDQGDVFASNKVKSIASVQSE